MQTNYFNKLLESIQVKILRQIPEFKEVGIFAGGFNSKSNNKEDYLLSTQDNNPKCKIGLSSVSNIINNNTGQIICQLDLSLVFTTQDEQVPGSSHMLALNILEKALLLIKDGKWEIENVYPTQFDSISAINHYDVDFLAPNMVMWIVKWKQQCVIGTDKFVDNGVFPTTYSVQTDISSDDIFDERYSQNSKAK